MQFVFHPAITLVSSTIQYALWFLTAGLILKERYPRWITILAVVFSLLCEFCATLTPLLSSVRILFGMPLVILTMLLVFDGRWYLKLFVAASIMITLLVSEILIIPLIPTDVPSAEVPLSDQLVLYAIYLFIQSVLLAILLLAVRILKQRHRGIAFSRQIMLFALFPVSQYFVLTGWFLNRIPYLNLGTPLNRFSIFVLLAADTALLVSIQATARSAALEVQNHYLQEQISAEQTHYAHLVENYESIRQMRHDIDNHLYTIKALLSEGNTEDAARYAQEIYQAHTDCSSLEAPGEPEP